MVRSLFPACLAALLAQPLAADACRPAPSEGPDDFDRLSAEIMALPTPTPSGVVIGGQQVWTSGSTPVTARLARLASGMSAVIAEAGATGGRPVYIVESLGDTYPETGAFTLCPETASEPPWVDHEGLPDGTCLIVVYPDRSGGPADLDFTLAHEWMHTLQTGSYGVMSGNFGWWREGSADWFAHRVVPGFTQRDYLVADFFERQKTCPLTDQSYAAQVFFFWADAELYTRWVFETGMGDAEYLDGPARAATILPPERWLDFAKAQADKTVHFPDGRALSASVPVAPLGLGASCQVTLDGPPLSAQVRSESFAPDFADSLQIGITSGLLAMRQGDGPWEDLADGTVLEPLPAGDVTFAAISASGNPLDISLTIMGGANPSCACHIGTWIEEELADGFRFRQPTEVAGIPAGPEGRISIEYDQDGPVLTFAADGTYRLDDPYTAILAGPDGDGALMGPDGIAWQVRLPVNLKAGRWAERLGRLVLIQEQRRQDGTLTINGMPVDWNEERRRRTSSTWTPKCSGDELVFFGPMAPELQATGTTPEVIARFHRYGP